MTSLHDRILNWICMLLAGGALAGVAPCAIAETAAGAAPRSPAATSPTDCAAASTPDQKLDDDTIRRIEQGWITAEYRGNPRFLECLLEADYRTSGRSGQMRTRQDVLDQVARSTDLNKPVPVLQVIVFIHGSSAMAHSIMKSTDKNGNPKEVHFVDCYSFHDGRWFAYGGADL